MPSSVKVSSRGWRGKFNRKKIGLNKGLRVELNEEDSTHIDKTATCFNLTFFCNSAKVRRTRGLSLGPVYDLSSKAEFLDGNRMLL